VDILSFFFACVNKDVRFVYGDETNFRSFSDHRMEFVPGSNNIWILGDDRPDNISAGSELMNILYLQQRVQSVGISLPLAPYTE
jgi:hypothetical protein